MTRGLAALFSILLIACGPRELSFNDDPAIVRGTWVGTASGLEVKTGRTTSVSWPLRLELSATWTDTTRYEVSGTLRLADDPALEVKGFVNGGGDERYVLAPPPKSLWLEAVATPGSVGFVCHRMSYSEAYNCTLWIDSSARRGNYRVEDLRRP